MSTEPAEKRFARRVRTINDPVTLLLLVVRVLGPLHRERGSKEHEIIRRAQWLRDRAMRERAKISRAKREALQQ